MTYPGELMGQGLPRFPVSIEEKQVTAPEFLRLSVEIIEIAEPRAKSDILMHFTKSTIGCVVQPKVMPARGKLFDTQRVTVEAEFIHHRSLDNFFQFRPAINTELVPHRSIDLEFRISVYIRKSYFQLFHFRIFGVEQAK